MKFCLALSLEPQEFKAMVDAIRTAEKALDEVRYEVSQQEAKSRVSAAHFLWLKI